MLIWANDSRWQRDGRESCKSVTSDGTYYGVLYVSKEYLAYHSDFLSWGNSYPTADAAKQACEDHAIEQVTARLLGERGSH